MKTAPITATLIDYMGNDLSCVNAARVSFEKESQLVQRELYSDDNEHVGTVADLSVADKGLIHYLAKHKHFSPFNHAFLSFRVKAPIFVSRQLVKHKFMPWNEVSRRYVDSEPEFYVPEDWRAKADNVKQGSQEGGVENSYYYKYATQDHCQNCLDLYNEYLADGICPEMARMVLPANMMTEWQWSGSLGAFLDMLVLRLDPHTQYESRVVAEMIAEHVKQLFPVSYDARINGTV